MINDRSGRFFRPRALVFALFLMIPFLTLAGCDLAKNSLKSDREGGLETQDYRDSLASRLPESDSETKDTKGGAIPELQSYISHSDQSMKAMPLVSIEVNQSVPLRDALFELAQQAHYDIELDPRITGSIIFTARDRPFDEVIERIAETSGLRYKFEDDMLRVELDTPYNKSYKVDYLSYIRANKSGTKSDTSVSGGDVNMGSDFSTSSESESNFWGELETNLEQIVRGNQTGALKTKKDPKVTAVDQNPNVQAVGPDANGNITVQPPQATLNVQALPVEGGDEPQPGEKDSNEGTFTINKQAGLINVFASERAQKEVDAYLKLLRRAVTSQVLIETKILEVTLNDEFATGIDWNALNIIPGKMSLDFLGDGTSRSSSSLLSDTAASMSGTTIANGKSVVLGYTGGDVQTLIQAISGFGTVKALASPRLTVLNNQSAVLNVSTNRVFFDLDVDVTEATDTTAATTNITSDIRNIPEGVLVNVQPSINLDERTISIALRPTVTKVVDSIPDPAIQYITAANGIDGVESLVPEVNVQEVDSVIQVRDGQPVVMGGLLQDRATSDETGVPFLSETPMIGSLFKNHNDLVKKTELIIFLKATILDTPSESIHDTDKDLYRQFSSDRRPLRF